MKVYATSMLWALRTALNSPDPSTQNGAVIHGTMLADCNRLPDGVLASPERWARPLKYRFVEHAERNVIYMAASLGIQLHGQIMVCPWAACSDCARAIVQSGLAMLVRYPMQGEAGNHWHDDCLIGDEILREGGVKIIEEPFHGLQVPNLRRNGGRWQP